MDRTRQQVVAPKGVEHDVALVVATDVGEGPDDVAAAPQHHRELRVADGSQRVMEARARGPRRDRLQAVAIVGVRWPKPRRIDGNAGRCQQQCAKSARGAKPVHEVGRDHLGLLELQLLLSAGERISKRSRRERRRRGLEDPLMAEVYLHARSAREVGEGGEVLIPGDVDHAGARVRVVFARGDLVARVDAKVGAQSAVEDVARRASVVDDEACHVAVLREVREGLDRIRRGFRPVVVRGDEADVAQLLDERRDDHEVIAQARRQIGDAAVGLDPAVFERDVQLLDELRRIGACGDDMRAIDGVGGDVQLFAGEGVEDFVGKGDAGEGAFVAVIGDRAVDDLEATGVEVMAKARLLSLPQLRARLDEPTEPSSIAAE